MATTTMTGPSGSPQKLIAPVWHTILVLLFAAFPLISGALLQSRKTPNGQIYASHSQVMLRFYVPILILEWLVVWFIYAGVRRRGVTLKELIGGRWQTAKNVIVDGILALAVCAAMLLIGGILSRLLPASTAKGIDIILPQGAFEMFIWVCVSITAGFVEELVFRGYLQTQFVRMGLPAAFAVIAQAVVFAGGHLYEGRNSVVVIFVYAVLFGLLTIWRKSLRPGMVGHAIFDAIAPILSRL